MLRAKHIGLRLIPNEYHARVEAAALEKAEAAYESRVTNEHKEHRLKCAVQHQEEVRKGTHDKAMERYRKEAMALESKKAKQSYRAEVYEEIRAELEPEIEAKIIRRVIGQ